jgi:TolB-like protein/Tfp pilus assembly protein PilF
MQLSFGDFVLDVDSRELRRGSEPVRLSPKAYQLLEILVTSRPKALSKGDLQNRLWPNTFVVEKNLANLVGEIRQALGESPSDPRFIRTVPRYGYAFLEASSELDAPDTQTPARMRHWPITLGVAVSLGVMAYALLSVTERPRAPAARVMLAVLPFQNLTGDPEQDYLSDGLTEELIAQLGGLQPSRLGVIARTSALHYKNTAKRADEIGRELGVDYLLETSVRRTGNRIRIAAQLIELEGQTHVWAEQHDHDMQNLLVLQRDVAAAITRRVVDTLGLERRTDIGRGRHTSSAAAYEEYLRGRWHWAKDTVEGLQRAREHFQRAIALDATYALAYSGLADTYALLGSYDIMPISESHPLGREAAQKALAVNESLGDAHKSLAAILADYYWDWAGAERHFKRAIELDPNSAGALHSYSFYLAYTGRPAEAISLAERAVRLDPVSLRAQVNLGVVLNMARRYDDAVTQLERALELDSSFAMAHAMLGLSYAYQGMHERAVAHMMRARSASGARPDLIALHGYALARAGREREALAALDYLHRHPGPGGASPFLLAVVYVGLEDQDRAFDWLHKAVLTRAWELPMLKGDPVFDPLRSDPRFPGLLDQLNLPH